MGSEGLVATAGFMLFCFMSAAGAGSAAQRRLIINIPFT